MRIIFNKLVPCYIKFLQYEFQSLTCTSGLVTNEGNKLNLLSNKLFYKSPELIYSKIMTSNIWKIWYINDKLTQMGHLNPIYCSLLPLYYFICCFYKRRRTHFLLRRKEKVFSRSKNERSKRRIVCDRYSWKMHCDKCYKCCK